MNRLMQKGWRFVFYANELGTITAIAKKGKKQIITDGFSWWTAVNAIVAKVDSLENGR